ncbi:MAG TPA: prepilin-type N-terminal cleavage/methylation domain-containing protein [Steroidobacteraceae bacterium]|nr:prepilin-type N-terminal cleavage/methylation domain-containing protein [Steroidobacteraceae bacterium]
MRPTKFSGFTLIELVVVITILGILAAFAVPKFIALDTQARVATINGLAGTVKSAAALARGMSMATGNAAQVTMEGATVTLSNNYPDASATGIPNAVNTAATDFTYTAGATGIWAKVGAPGTCTVTYAPATVAAGVVTPPVITTQTGGC